MKVYVTGRQGGKTAKLIQWLLEGNPIPNYPGWSHAIVCSTHHQVINLSNRVRKDTEHLEGVLSERALIDLRKSIWSFNDLSSIQRGTFRNYEIAIDDADQILSDYFGRPPTLITMTGEIEV